MGTLSSIGIGSFSLGSRGGDGEEEPYTVLQGDVDVDVDEDHEGDIRSAVFDSFVALEGEEEEGEGGDLGDAMLFLYDDDDDEEEGGGDIEEMDNSAHLGQEILP